MWFNLQNELFDETRILVLIKFNFWSLDSFADRFLERNWHHNVLVSINKFIVYDSFLSQKLKCFLSSHLSILKSFLKLVLSVSPFKNKIQPSGSFLNFGNPPANCRWTFTRHNKLDNKFLKFWIEAYNINKNSFNPSVNVIEITLCFYWRHFKSPPLFNVL